jgi:chemotaxis methyl-accepting protein methylase
MLLGRSMVLSGHEVYSLSCADERFPLSTEKAGCVVTAMDMSLSAVSA